MNDLRKCPADEAWRDWIRGPGQIALAEDRLLDHLDGCETCQQVVAKLSADDAFYCQSREALRSTGLTSHDWRDHGAQTTDPLTSEPLTFEALTSENSSPAVVSLIQSLLGPSDDDRSLGRLGRFEVLGVVGSGGMGIVLKARSIAMDRVVAIKIPQPQYWQSPETLSTLEREARSAAAVVHPNVISIYHVDRYRDVPYLVMPYLPGQSLEQRIRQSGPMPIAETLRIGRQVASALAAAHACGVVHRDVKPANILLGAGTERVVLSDFGLAKIQSDATCTATGTFAGTPIYLSPEQASGCGAGPAGDIYSLGTVLWTMLCGQPPMSGMHTHAIVRRIADSKVPRLSDHRPGLPGWLNQLISKLHADAPADRPSADQLTDWIEACQRYLLDSRSARLPEELLVVESKPKRWFAAAAAVVATMLLAVGAWLMSDPPASDSNPKAIVSSPKAIGSTAPAPTSVEPLQSVSSVALPEVALPDETDRYLDQIDTELKELNETTLPRWESEVERLLEQ